MLPSDDQSGERGADVRPLFDKLSDHLNTSRDAAINAENRAASLQTAGVPGFDPAAIAQTPARLTPAPDGMAPSDPATLMESMVLALSTASDTQQGTT